MTREDDTLLLSRLIDGLLGPEEEQALRRRLELDPELAETYRRLLGLRRELREAIAPPPVSETEWNDLALGAVSRHGQRLGWLLLTPSVLALVAGCLAMLFTDPEVPLWLRLAVGGLAAGTTFLLISAIADRLRARRVERYDEVQR
ncbi:MAG: hypothetical protein Q9Q40_03050 [Acidobacteriota bacterium]|nr:hypothetical protein [Acidobacteriota bacterium]